MKKVLILMFVILGAYVSQAQIGRAYTFPTIAGDSLVNQDTVFKTIPVTDGYKSIGIQVSIKKGTGTLDGKFYLYKSVNGGSYVLSDSASFTAVPTFAAASNGGYTYTAIIEKAAPAGTSYVVAATQAGSLTSSPVKVWYTVKK